jgi:phage host-nuclease inhibitor protein Gam
MARRQKKKVISGVSADDAQKASADYVNAFTEQKKIEAKMNEEINKIKSKYQDRITELEEAKEEPYEILNVYATEQKDNWGKAKSIELLHTKIGFRIGMPKLKCDKGFNWTSVTPLLQDHFPDYVRTVIEPNKEKLIADRDSEGFEKMCKKAHIEVVQDENFFVEPKLEELAAA